MIRLDWDDCSYGKMLKRIEQMKRSILIQSIEIRASPSLDGYHCIISTFDHIPRNYEHFLRREWWDDIRRLILMILVSRKDRYSVWNEKIFDKTQNVLERWL